MTGCACHGPCPCHGRPMTWLDGDRHPRCRVTGHRKPNPFTGRRPVATRWRPWRALQELARRRDARIAGLGDLSRPLLGDPPSGWPAK